MDEKRRKLRGRSENYLHKSEKRKNSSSENRVGRSKELRKYSDSKGEHLCQLLMTQPQAVNDSSC